MQAGALKKGNEGQMPSGVIPSEGILRVIGQVVTVGDFIRLIRGEGVLDEPWKKLKVKKENEEKEKRYSRDASHRSASMAAWQPMPAAVTAWR